MYDEINQDKFVRECEHYIEENVAAPYIAFYLARGYSLDVLGTSSLNTKSFLLTNIRIWTTI